MARVARRESPSGYYHVMVRGNNRETIFSKRFEKQYFIELLSLKQDEGRISIVAYCIMDNHAHLLIHSDLVEMSEIIKWINVKYALRYNFIHDRIGHVFQGRYKSEIISTDSYLLQAIKYIHNNPVKAGIVSEPLNYPWSSYKSYLENSEEMLLNLDEKQIVLDMFSGSLNDFNKFHLSHEKIVEEDYEFIDIKQDIDLYREERAQIIIENYCLQQGITDAKEFYNKRDAYEKMIIELLKSTKLSHRKISELMNTTRGTIHSIAKKQL
ncbi:REP element-mobilizing transposase RayT [Sedimentibacter acidaminivorans]|uniref:REP element-mobilizing transposase RayT n=1 Tax=Sedimentibacter acidaminivorans TaxID=913099 RepID=A0ABS4GHV2_9FIRM|nr:transposase [Sedimentibacter acidaminivorans]MBP1927276.1 REP element-mobilizing transposase RayT [Sedimentibacter acidaminivorans]